MKTMMRHSNSHERRQKPAGDLHSSLKIAHTNKKKNTMKTKTHICVSLSNGTQWQKK